VDGIEDRIWETFTCRQSEKEKHLKDNHCTKEKTISNETSFELPLQTLLKFKTLERSSICIGRT